MTMLDRIRRVLRAEAEAIQAVQVTPAFSDAAFVIAGCRSKVVTMGMGKAGIVAQKMAATLSSTRTPAVFLHPADAAHGDLGVIQPGDVVVAFSTSGKTTEVIEALESARRLDPMCVIGITSHPESAFGLKCSTVLDMGRIEEPCPIGLTPTASSAVMLAIADALAIAVMELKGVTAGDFGARHRAGYLGARAEAMA